MFYTKQEAKKLKPKTWAAWAKGSMVIVKAYKKENALRRLQEIDRNVVMSDLYASSTIGAGMCDRIEDKGFQYNEDTRSYDELFEIVYGG